MAAFRGPRVDVMGGLDQGPRLDVMGGPDPARYPQAVREDAPRETCGGMNPLVKPTANLANPVPGSQFPRR